MIDQESDEAYRELKRQKLDQPQPSKRELFPSLKSDEVARKLDEFISDLKKKSEEYNIAHGIQGPAKNRKNVRENFTFSLLLGVEEARERAEIEQLTGLKKPEDQSTILDFCSNLASRIESGMWVDSEEKIVIPI